eukprot:4318222-Ditylum_brightwellii.AAC.1
MGIASKLTVCLNNDADAVVKYHMEIPSSVQPILTPDDYDLVQPNSASSKVTYLFPFLVLSTQFFSTTALDKKCCRAIINLPLTL